MFEELDYVNIINDDFYVIRSCSLTLNGLTVFKIRF